MCSDFRPNTSTNFPLVGSSCGALHGLGWAMFGGGVYIISRRLKKVFPCLKSIARLRDDEGKEKLLAIAKKMKGWDK
ncbi:transmembrane protein, putative [Medicago truncatula]|uniref:Transmembrane protein, putative n=1 Tax=Medicago truncatula TaxID=3880 RepID=G7J3A1_MEDTR|nr:transmembrane protein, putative [Medicago truncatula]